MLSCRALLMPLNSASVSRVLVVCESFSFSSFHVISVFFQSLSKRDLPTAIVSFTAELLFGSGSIVSLLLEIFVLPPVGVQDKSRRP